MGMFAQKVAAATPGESGGSLWFKDGEYPLIQIDQVKLVISTHPSTLGVEKFVVVADILDSKVPDRPAGMRGVSHTLNGLHASAAKDCKNFLIAAFPEVDASEWDKEHALNPEDERSIVHPTIQPAHGRLLSLTVYTKLNAKGELDRFGKVKQFTVHRYMPVSEEIQAKAAELRAKAGLPPF